MVIQIRVCPGTPRPRATSVSSLDHLGSSYFTSTEVRGPRRNNLVEFRLVVELQTTLGGCLNPRPSTSGYRLSTGACGDTGVVPTMYSSGCAR